MGFSLTLPLVGLIPKSTTILRYACNAVEKISLWSYSIYLCHIPVLFIVYKLLINERSNPLINFLSKVLGLGIAILISAFIYKYVEVPLMKKRPAEIKD
jgi:peptidoglycan/LPS O-acetylase OafA/YrhL